MQGNTSSRLDKGANRLTLRNTRSCMGSVKSMAEQVTPREDATGAQSRWNLGRFAASSNSPAVIRFASNKIPNVADTDNAKPRSPPEKGLTTQMTSTANPSEFTLSGSLPRQSAKSASRYMIPLRTADTGKPVSARNPTTAPAVSRFFPVLPSIGSVPNSRERNTPSAAMCSPEITSRWEAPMALKLQYASSETLSRSPSSMARISPLSPEGKCFSNDLPMVCRSSANSFPGGLVVLGAVITVS